MFIEFDKDYLRKRDVVNEQIITVCRLLDISNHYK